jgi:amino acid transporter
MLPLIAVTGNLLFMDPTGGLYSFAKDVSSYLGFLSCWSYFIGKLASATVMLTVATTMFRALIPALGIMTPLITAISILTLFTALNLLNMKVGLIVQSFFLTAKSIPILFALFAGALLFNTHTIIITPSAWQGIALNIPLVLYCLAGFETACALGRTIENPAVNGPKAVYYSFGIIMSLYGIFQACIYYNIAHALDVLTSYQDVFPCIAHQLISSEVIAQKLSFLLIFAIGSSALGGAYGILFSNSWNLYTLAEHGHIFQSELIMQKNKHNTPWIAVLVEAFVCFMFLLLSQASIIPIQRIASLGIVIAYTVSSLSYCILAYRLKVSIKNKILSYLALITCMLFATTCAVSFIDSGIIPLLLFGVILLIGSIMYAQKRLFKDKDRA